MATVAIYWRLRLIQNASLRLTLASAIKPLKMSLKKEHGVHLSMLLKF
jgi:hypothetical protein